MKDWTIMQVQFTSNHSRKTAPPTLFFSNPVNIQNIATPTHHILAPPTKAPFKENKKRFTSVKAMDRYMKPTCYRFDNLMINSKFYLISWHCTNNFLPLSPIYIFTPWCKNAIYHPYQNLITKTFFCETMWLIILTWNPYPSTTTIS